MSQLSTGHKRPEHAVDMMTWENDKLKRRKYADILTEIIHKTEGPYVIGLNSEWGSGKTFFLRAWQNQLVSEGKPCVYINAWETDHVDDPLVAFMGCLKNQLQSQGWSNAHDFEKLHKSVGKILKNTPKFGMKLLYGYINSKTDGALDEVSEDLFQQVGQNAVDMFIESMQGNDAFVKSLTEVSESIKNREDNAGKFPLLIMVDELDRCRPDYAITLLERVKHLFSVPGVVFLFAIDGAQLVMIAEHRFGFKSNPWEGDEQISHIGDSRIDYLRKFFDAFYRLPQPDKGDYFKHIMKTMDIKCKYVEGCDITRDFYINTIATDDTLYADKSLRSILQCLEKVSMFTKCYYPSGGELFLAIYIVFKTQNILYSSYGAIEHLFTDKDKKALEAMRSIGNLMSSKAIDNTEKYIVSQYELLDSIGVNNEASISNLFIKCLLCESMVDIISSYSNLPNRSVERFAKSFTAGPKSRELEDIVRKKLESLEDFLPTPQGD